MNKNNWQCSASPAFSISSTWHNSPTSEYIGTISNYVSVRKTKTYTPEEPLPEDINKIVFQWIKAYQATKARSAKEEPLRIKIPQVNQNDPDTYEQYVWQWTTVEHTSLSSKQTTPIEDDLISPTKKSKNPSPSSTTSSDKDIMIMAS